MQDSQKNKKSINLLKSGDSQKPFSSITLKRDSREESIVFTSSHGIVQSIGREPSHAYFESIERESSSSLKQQGMILALLRSVKPKMKKTRFAKKMNYPVACSGVFIGKSFSHRCKTAGNQTLRDLKKHKINEGGY